MTIKRLPPDPRHPGRPDTDAFWMISEGVREFDDRADAGENVVAITKDLGVDIETLTYIASTRIGLAAARGVPIRVVPAALGLWMDGFVAGAAYGQIRAREGL